ncbi:MAG: 1-acyl-sn-glycerol-3-phosphate acyltransferase [Verrucomicrobia bacterium]|nr:1-acyl-sn-glycerol-3-phosphate acyltransferase [Verrucomicrobiota bacterium]
MKRHPLRVLRRFFVFTVLILLCLLEFIFCIWLRGKASSARARADWLQRWSRRHLRNINAEIQRSGQPPARGLLVSNHLSYLDILVLAEAQPMVFLSKAEVRDWPLIGWLTRCAGTLYIQREQKSDVARVNAQFATVVEQGLVLAIFPEGTSTGGNTLLPFRSSVLAPAVEQQWAITPTWIGYSLEDGLVEEEICYWRDMTFGLHALNLLSKRRVTVHVAYAASIEAGPDRKELARQLHAQVCDLAERHGGKKLRGSPGTL